MGEAPKTQIKAHQRATSTHQQENPPRRIGEAPKTQLKAQHWSTRGPQAPNNKRPLNGQWEGRQRPNSRPNTDPPEGHKHPTTRDPSMANGRGDKDPNQGSTLTHQRATSTHQHDGPLMGHQRPNSRPNDNLVAGANRGLFPSSFCWYRKKYLPWSSRV
jgi:hypothetical protein